MPFLKTDLVGDDYNWSIEGGVLYEGSPSRRIFNRNNGDQVLFLINFYGSQADKYSLQEGRRMEELIQYHLPLDAKSEISVFNWLRTIMQASPGPLPVSSIE